MRRLLAVALGAVLFLSTAFIVFAASYSFTGTPPQPLSYTSGIPDLALFDVQVHERGMSRGHDVPDMAAQHGPDCSGPPNSHPITAPNQTVFQCNDHVMTSLNGDEYGVIYLTPPQLADFSTGPAVVEWQMSTLRMSQRDWWDVTISPFEDSQALPLCSSLSQGVDLQNPNRNAIWVGAENGQGAPSLRVVRNGDGGGCGDGNNVLATGPALNVGIPSNVNQAAVRQTMRLTLTASSAKLERLANTGTPAVVFFNTTFSPVAWRLGVVNIGHHSYDPEKDGSGVPASWHWDEVSISPSRPLYIAPLSPRYTNRAQTVTSASPAPSGAFLRFSALCNVSVNGVFAQRQTDSGHHEHFASYMVPVAQGSSSWVIGFSGDNETGGNCAFKDASIFSMQGGASSPSPTATATTPTSTPTATTAPSPSATSTASPTPTASASPTPTPSVTPSPSPSSTPSPTTTPSPSPTASPTPSATATPTPGTPNDLCARLFPYRNSGLMGLFYRWLCR